MIFPMMIKRSKTILFDKRLTVFDKYLYFFLLELSITSAYQMKDLLKIMGGGFDEKGFYLSLGKLEELGYVKTKTVQDDDRNDVYCCIGDSDIFPEFSVNKLKAFKFLDSKPLFRNVAFYALLKRHMIRRQGEFSNNHYPISLTAGFSAYRTEENAILYYFARKNISKFEEPRESLDELKYCGISTKKFSKYLINRLGKISIQLSEDAPLTSFYSFLKTCPPPIKLAMSIFLEGCVFLAKDTDSPEEFRKVIFNLEKSKKRVIPKKEAKKELNIKTNPKLPAKYSAVVDFWNSKNLVKHKNYNSKTVVNACKVMDKLIKGTFNDSGIRYNIDDFYSAIETMDAMANDPNVKPTGLKQKTFLKKLSIENFFYSTYTGKSKFIDIMELGSITLTKPYSEEAFDSLCKITQKITNTKITSKNKNNLAVFLNSVKLFFDNNRKRLEYESTVIKICGSIIRSLTKNGKWLNYNFLISEEMRSNYILKICLEEGFIIGVKKQEESLVYRKVRR